MDVKKIFQELCRRFCVRSSGLIFGVKLDLHIYKTVKDFKTYSLIDIAAANARIMKKTRGLYRVSERRYFSFSPGPFWEIVAIRTYRAGCSLGTWLRIFCYTYVGNTNFNSIRGLLDRSMARYFYKRLKTSLHKPTGNLFKKLVLQKMCI